MTIFADGKGNVSGCQCKPRCEFPCWQREGIGPPCPDCGCPTDLFPPPDPEPSATVRDILPPRMVELARREADDRTLVCYGSKGWYMIANEDDVTRQSVVLTTDEVRWLAELWRPADEDDCTDPCADAGCPAHGDDPMTLVPEGEDVI